MNTMDLNGIWDFAFFKGKKLEEISLAEAELSETICVPSCFDTLPHYYCQRGCGVYSRSFLLEYPCVNAYLKIEGMGLRSALYLDGSLIGECSLPYSTFELPCGSLAEGKHVLTILVDNNFDPEKMKLFLPGYDFYAFGGLYHGVSLRFSQEEDPLHAVRVRTLSYEKREIELEFRFKGETPETFEAFLSIDDEAERSYTVENGKLVLQRADLALWDVEDPVLHTLCVRVNGECIRTTFGIRQICTKGRKILLNGKEIYLKGFNRHNSSVHGSAVTMQEMMTDLQHLKTLGANFIRGSHYSLDSAFLDLCDRMGFLVWEETLGWGNTPEQMADHQFIAQQLEQARLMVDSSFNHPSVIFFAFLNENFSGSDEGEALCRQLAETIRGEDTGRLVSFACSHTFSDKALACMDVLTFNTYPGWISAKPSLIDPLDEIAPHLEKIRRRLLDDYEGEKPILVTEMGCCALYGQHDEAAAQWTEEFQAQYLEEVLSCVSAVPEFCGIAIWQMNDAKSYLRAGENIRGKPIAQNLAGVYDLYRRPKLAARVVAEKFRTMP